ncbi:hypothetical protein FUA23_01435 [Neolewinella aurantiaca]|uniref:Uncharacterized protein n=1 Tax=Neolewinella aurantiaca TaxID=2602767 RepID=A0A5C7FKX5_9BACT|nr:hypothetical protein [Neolewinella aurantiaca]TXF91387.1 hypothetical protein FUA23_01435 [Neolewinella aurantiaca]
MSSKLNIERGSGELLISYSWRTPVMWFLLFFCIIWNGICLFTLFAGAGFFVVFHVIAGLFITWWTLTRFINKTIITVDRQKLLIKNGPVPWPFAKDKNVPARALVQLFVAKSNVSQNKQSTYKLMARLDTGTEVKLIDAEPDKALLLDLERTIEAYLDITNDTSLDLKGHGNFEGLDLNELREQMNKLEPIKKWLPKSITNKMEEAAARLEAEERRNESGSPQLPREEDWDVTLTPGSRIARPLQGSEHDFVFPFYRLQQGEPVKYSGKPYRMGRSAQIDWDDEHISQARQMEIVPVSGGEPLHFYAQIERNRWSYFEERRLDDEEVEILGFVAEKHPLRFENGRDRYYPRDGQNGVRFMSGTGRQVEQFIYFTTSSSTQFRALKPEGRGWEVYVMEVVDAGNFE